MLASDFKLQDKNRPLPTVVSKLHIEDGLVRISAGMVGILLNSCSPRELQRLTPESGVCLEGTTMRARMSYGVAESELLIGGHGAEAGARSDELQIADRAGR